MAEPQVSDTYHNSPIGYRDHPQAQERRVRGLSSCSRSNVGYFLAGSGVDLFKDDSSQVGSGAADRLPAGGVPAQALSDMAIAKKVQEGIVPNYHPQTNAHLR